MINFKIGARRSFKDPISQIGNHLIVFFNILLLFRAILIIQVKVVR